MAEASVSGTYQHPQHQEIDNDDHDDDDDDFYRKTNFWKVICKRRSEKDIFLLFETWLIPNDKAC